MNRVLEQNAEIVEDLIAKDAEIKSMAWSLYNMKQQDKSRADEINRLKKQLEKEKPRTKRAEGKSRRPEALANWADF